MMVVARLLVAKQLARLIVTVVLPAPPLRLITSVVFIFLRFTRSSFFLLLRRGHHALATWQNQMRLGNACRAQASVGRVKPCKGAQRRAAVARPRGDTAAILPCS